MYCRDTRDMICKEKKEHTEQCYSLVHRHGVMIIIQRGWWNYSLCWFSIILIVSPTPNFTLGELGGKGGWAQLLKVGGHCLWLFDFWLQVINITLQVWSSVTSIFLAARSLCTKHFFDRYSIPEAIWRQKLIRRIGSVEGTNSPGL